MKTRLGLGEETQRDNLDPSIDDTMAADPSNPSGHASAPLVGAAAGRGGEPVRGDSIGRFVVLGVLGSGGMGVVYSAYDPHLDRKVAIKLLGSSVADQAGDAQVRLLREAQAMAKINHPNVIKVHEVGTFGEQIYLAMEFADAGTLRGWLSAERRTIREILDAFTQAGRGLAGAHAVELVHRDFKPDNVLISKDGSIRVTDFGLVSVINAITRAPTEPLPEIAGVLSDSTPLSQELTRTGSIMGTPTYMAPEQFAGRASTGQTDQFAFCVALYEALYRERPFAGTSYPELSSRVLLGEISPPPAGTKVPTWLRRVLLRGLSTTPSDRYASMPDLLAALANDPRRRRRILAWVGACVVLVGVAVAILATRRAAGPVCGSGDDRVVDAWGPGERVRLGQAFAASGRPHAAASLARVTELTGAWMTTWKAGYVDACRATRVRAEQSDHVLDLRMQCLTRRLDEAHATLVALATGGGDAVDHAIEAALALPSVAPCADAAGLTAAVAPPEGDVARARVAVVRTEVDGARAQRKLGRYPAGLATARTALVAARATRYLPLVAEALILVGALQSDLAAPESASTLAEATRVAAEAGDTNTMIEAMTWRMFVLTQTNHEELAQELGELADASAKHARPPVEIVIRLDNAMALVLAKRGHLEDARARYDAALALARDLGPEHPAVSTTLNQLGILMKDQGHYADARKALEEVLAIRERVDGKDHPEVASALNNLGNVYRVEGKLDEAKGLYDRALAIRISALGPTHPEVGTSYNNLGIFYSESGDHATAQAYYQKALPLWESAYGKDSADVASVLANLGGSLNEQGDYAGARVHFERARTIFEAVRGPESSDVANILSNLGDVALNEHAFENALTLYQRAEHIAETALGPDHPDVADDLAHIASVYISLGKLREAEDMSTRALAVLAKAFGPDHPRVAGALVNYGALQLQRDEYAAALETYRRALAIFEAKLGKDHPFVAFASHGVGMALTDLNRQAEAVPYEARALALRIATKQAPDQIAEARFGLADALVANSRTRTRAVTEAKTALGEYEAAGDADNAREVRVWLRKHHAG